MSFFLYLTERGFEFSEAARYWKESWINKVILILSKEGEVYFIYR